MSGKAKGIMVCVVIALATLIVYWQILDHAFIHYDDDVYVTNNANIEEGFTRENIIWAFTTSYASNWHPVTWMSHILDYQNYGMNPRGHHLTSLLIHVGNAVLLFMVLMRITGALWQCAFVAAMFALHPLNVDSVAWVAERKNVLSAFFWLLTMWTYISYVEKKNFKRYALVVLFLALGLMSKPMGVTLPFVLLMLDYWPLGRWKFEEGGESLARLISEKIPLLALAIGSSIATYVIQSGKAMVTLEAYPLDVRIFNALVSYIEYLEKMIWPKSLAVFYPHPGSALPMWKGALCGIVLAAVSIMAVRTIRRAPYFAFGWFWYLGTLVPVIGIVQVGIQAMADRYMYVPLIGIFIVIAWGLPELMAKWPHRNKALAASAAIIFPLVMTAAWTQAGYWKNGVTLFTHAIEVADNEYPNLAIAYNNLGIAYNNFGVIRNDQGAAEKAMVNFRKAIELKPDYVEPYYSLGNILTRRGMSEEALPYLKEAIKLKPDHSQAYNNIGINLGRQGKYKAALYHFQMAATIDPEFFQAQNNLGLMLTKVGMFKEAVACYKKAIKLDPTQATPHYNLAEALLELGNPKEAVAHFQEAIRIAPNYEKAHKGLAAALAKLGSGEGALNPPSPLHKGGVKAPPL